jgi:hypothetical protein
LHWVDIYCIFPIPITIFVFLKNRLSYCIVSIWFIDTKITLRDCVDGVGTIHHLTQIS